MSWIFFYIDAIALIAKINFARASRQEQIDNFDFNPYCRDCDVPEGMDW
jgi:hypothetical protein